MLIELLQLRLLIVPSQDPEHLEGLLLDDLSLREPLTSSVADLIESAVDVARSRNRSRCALHVSDSAGTTILCLNTAGPHDLGMWLRGFNTTWKAMELLKQLREKVRLQP